MSDTKLKEGQKMIKLYGGEIEILFDQSLKPDGQKRHIYSTLDYVNLTKAGTPRKKRLTGVTTITGVIDKPNLIPWASKMACNHMREYLKEGEKYTMEELMPIIDEAQEKHNTTKNKAATTGSMIHDWAEKFAKAKANKEKIEIPKTEDEQYLNGIMAFLDWYNDNKVSITEAERVVYSKKHGFVGTLDAVAEIDGKKYLIDYKTSSGVYDEMKFQVSAYYKAYIEETGEALAGAFIVRFGKDDGEFEAHAINKGDLVKNYKTFKACQVVKKRLNELKAEWYKNRNR